MKLTADELDKQIKSLESDVAKYTQQLFETRGALAMVQHMKNTFAFEPKQEEKADVTSSPA